MRASGGIQKDVNLSTDVKIIPPSVLQRVVFWLQKIRICYLETFQVMVTASGVMLTDCKVLFGFFFPRITMRLAMV